LRGKKTDLSQKKGIERTIFTQKKKGRDGKKPTEKEGHKKPTVIFDKTPQKKNL